MTRPEQQDDEIVAEVITVAMAPSEWTTECPLCEETFAVDRVEEGPDGAFSPDDECRFIECAACGVVLHVASMRVERATP